MDLLKPQFLDEYYLLGKGIFEAVKTGKPSQFLKSQNVGFVGGYTRGLGAEVFRDGLKSARSPNAWRKGLLGGVRDGKVIGGWAESWREGRSFLKTGWQWSAGAMWPVLGAMAAYNAAKAPRGEKLGTFAGRMTGDLIGATAGALMFGAPGAFAGTLLFGSRIGEAVTGTFARAQSHLQRKNTLEMGGKYYDFSAARTMRQAAAAEMSGSLLNARQSLGQEAAMFHM
jgi:hypothetical protein